MRTLPANVTIRRATVEDCTSLAPRLRPEDVAEAYASSGLSADYAMKIALLSNSAVNVACIAGRPEMIFGCIGDEFQGRPWMLASPLPFTQQWSRVFLRHSRDAVNEWQSRFPLLANFADARNETHLKWLRWLGFVFIRREETHGFSGIPFLEFVRIKPNV